MTENQGPRIAGAKPEGPSSGKGRLLDHVHLVVASLEVSKKFYLAVVESIGLGDALAQKEGCFFIDELYVDEGVGNRSNIHLAFQANSRDAVDAFYTAALAAGGRKNGRPGVRRRYHPNYYAAYVLDPDGNNVEAVCHAGPDDYDDEEEFNECMPNL